MSGIVLAALGVLLLTIGAPTPANCLVEDILDVIKLGKEVTSSLLETWDIIEQTHAVNEVDIPFYKAKEKKILSRMTALQRQIDTVESEVSKTHLEVESNVTLLANLAVLQPRHLDHR